MPCLLVEKRRGNKGFLFQESKPVQYNFVGRTNARKRTTKDFAFFFLAERHKANNDPDHIMWATNAADGLFVEGSGIAIIGAKLSLDADSYNGRIKMSFGGEFMMQCGKHLHLAPLWQRMSTVLQTLQIQWQTRNKRNAILKQSRSNPQLLLNSNNEIYDACGHRPRFHRHVKQMTPSTDDSINDERASPIHEVTTDLARCNVCLADVQLEALWEPTKWNDFLFVSRALAL